MILRDESEARAPPPQEQAGTRFFPLSVPNQVAAQKVAWSFLLIRDIPAQKSLGTPSAGRGTNVLCISDAVAAVTGAHLDPPAPTSCLLAPGQGGLMDATDTNWYIPKRGTNPPLSFSKRRVQISPGTAEPHVRLQDVLQHPNTTQSWTRTTGSCFNIWVQSPPTPRAFESRIQGSILRSLVSPLYFHHSIHHALQMNIQIHRVSSSIPPTPPQEDTQFHPKIQGQWQMFGF